MQLETRRVHVGDEALLDALSPLVAPPYRPQRIFLPAIADRAFACAAQCRVVQPKLHPAYSVKTNPRGEMLDRARSHGLSAEVIGPGEFEHALGSGFGPEECIYNGPVPATLCPVAPGCIFADSIEAYEAAAARFDRALVGVRVRPRGIESHFGVTNDELERCAAAIARQGRPTLAVSFHVRPQDYAGRTWRDIVHLAIEAGRTLQEHSGARVVVFDVGGGKQPHEFDEAVRAGDFVWLERRLAHDLPFVERIVCELGQAIATPCEAVIAPICEVRRRARGNEIIVDAGYPELPQIATFQHRLFLAHSGALRRVAREGATNIFGRTCLEYDILAEGADVECCTTDDALVIADAGAYDASMAFSFAGLELGNT